MDFFVTKYHCAPVIKKSRDVLIVGNHASLLEPLYPRSFPQPGAGARLLDHYFIRLESDSKEAEEEKEEEEEDKKKMMRATSWPYTQRTSRGLRILYLSEAGR